MYVADAQGVAKIRVSVDGFSLTDPAVQPVLGRAIVIHNAVGAGARVGCGIIEPFSGEAVTFDRYPDYTGTSNVHGLMAMSSVTGGLLSAKGTLAGLEASRTGGWHVHSGTTCGPITLGTPNTVIGGHYFPGMTQDPWDVIRYTTDIRGVAQIDTSIGIVSGPTNPSVRSPPPPSPPPPSPPPPVGGIGGPSPPPGTIGGGGGGGVLNPSGIDGFSLYESNPVAGHAVVIHDATGGARAACGVVGEPYSRPQLSYATINNYPALVPYVEGYPATIGGTLTFEYLPQGKMLSVRGVITGLNASTIGGWHIHSGFSCESHSLVGGHFYRPNTPDSWMGVTYRADYRGVAELMTYLPGFALSRGPLAVNGHALVIHNSFGTRIGCGVITPAYRGSTVHMRHYPGSSRSSVGVGGVLVMQGLSATGPVGAAGGTNAGAGGLTVTGTLHGLPRNAPAGGGWHVHSGFTCDQPDGVFGHYFAGMASDPWNDISYGATDRKGVVQISQPKIDGFSLIGARPVDLRAVVVHDPNTKARIGCGIIGAFDDTTTATIVEGTSGGVGSLGGGFFATGDVVAALAMIARSSNANFIDVGVLWMRTSHPLLVGVGTVLLVAALTIVLFPGTCTALGLGYTWTYAYGGDAGVGYGSIAFVLGTLLGCVVCYLLGTMATAKKCVAKAPEPGCLKIVLHSLDTAPFKLIALLRSTPLIPFNLLNYYVGACGRFKVYHVLVGHIFTIPLSFMFVGVGGAIHKLVLVGRGQADSYFYEPMIWTGLSLTIALFVLQALFFLFFTNKTIQKAKGGALVRNVDVADAGGPPPGGPPPGPAPPAGPPPPEVAMSDLKLDVQSASSAESAAPPPPPPDDEELNLAPGWRPVSDDNGETYYFNDDTGESQWDPPMADDDVPPPPPP